MKTTEFLSNRTYFILFALSGIVYLAGLFVPLMDNDSTHYADIALNMYLSSDYATLRDHTGPYLDKPHLLFWLAAFSYKIFGVSGFAYKFPSLLFTILGTYSTYRLGKILYTPETGKLAALIIASSFAYILANNDVRMDAILSASIAFAVWQLVEFVHTKSVWSVAGAALGMALGFSTKGDIAIFAPLAAVGFYIFYRKEWRLILNWKWLLMGFLFAVFITPVVYSYYLQYNLHPEIMVRGKNNIDGVRFILLTQSFERFGGEMGQRFKNDYTFFLHSFIWAFAPWGIIAFMAFFRRVKNVFKRSDEWLTAGGFAIVMLVLSLSGFKLPHYINIVFPLAAVMVASFILSIRATPKWVNSVWLVQLISAIIILLLIVALNAWAFSVKNTWLAAAVLLMSAILYFLIKKSATAKWQQAVVLPVCVMIVSFFLLNTNFYFQLLHYQGSSELAVKTKGKIDPANVYLWKDNYKSSYFFYTVSPEKDFHREVLQAKKTVWILIDEAQLQEVKQEGYSVGPYYAAVDYSIAKLKLNFLNPATRTSKCTRMLLVQISRK